MPADILSQDLVAAHDLVIGWLEIHWMPHDSLIGHLAIRLAASLLRFIAHWRVTVMNGTLATT